MRFAPRVACRALGDATQRLGVHAPCNPRLRAELVDGVRVTARRRAVDMVRQHKHPRFDFSRFAGPLLCLILLVPGALGETMAPPPASSTADTSGPPTQASPHFAQIDLSYGKTLYFQRWSEAGLNLYASQDFPSGWLPCTKFQTHNEVVACYEGNAAILLASDEAKQYDSNFSTLYVLGAIVYPEGNLRPPIVARWDTALQEYVDVGYTDRVGQSRFCRKCFVTSEIVSDIHPYVALNLSPYPRVYLETNGPLAADEAKRREQAARLERIRRNVIRYGGGAAAVILPLALLIVFIRVSRVRARRHRIAVVQEQLDAVVERETRSAQLQRLTKEKLREAEAASNEARKLQDMVRKEADELLREGKFDG